MADPFVAEIRMVTFDFAPKGWAFCDGQLLPLSQNTALFSLLGTMYGGDGRSTFGLPDLRGMMPLAVGQGQGLSYRDQGESSGSEGVTLLQSELPGHTHSVKAAAVAGTVNSPIGATWAQPRYGRSAEKAWALGTPNRTMSPGALAQAGGNLPHNNLPPYLVVNFIIALQGVFPPRS